MTIEQLWKTCANMTKESEIRLYSTMGDYIIGLYDSRIAKIMDFGVVQLTYEIDAFIIENSKNIIHIIIK